MSANGIVNLIYTSINSIMNYLEPCLSTSWRVWLEYSFSFSSNLSFFQLQRVMSDSLAAKCPSVFTRCRSAGRGQWASGVVLLKSAASCGKKNQHYKSSEAERKQWSCSQAAKPDDETGSKTLLTAKKCTCSCGSVPKFCLFCFFYIQKLNWFGWNQLLQRQKQCLWVSFPSVRRLWVESCRLINKNNDCL